MCREGEGRSTQYARLIACTVVCVCFWVGVGVERCTCAGAGRMDMQEAIAMQKAGLQEG